MQDDDPTETNPFAELAPPAPAKRPHAAPPGYLWLHYLFLRPRRFFQHFVVEPTPLLTAFCAWTCGMAESIDQVQERTFGENLAVVDFGWAIFWGVVVALGAVAGVLYFVIGGLWYRVRLSWSGAVDVDRRLATRVYLFASQVYALPAVLAMVADTRTYPTPTAAAVGGPHWWHLVVLVCLFWSVYVSYAGVRTAFRVRRGRAMLWFLILPGLSYAVAVGGLFLAGVLAGLGPPDVENPNTYRGKVISFAYPGNWWINDEDESFDPDHNVVVEPMQDACVNILVYETERDVESEMEASMMEASIELVRQQYDEFQESGSFATWGSFRGLGRSLRGRQDEESYVVRIFLSKIDDARVLEVREVCAVADLETVEPGFQQIARTLRILE
jgi:hypothetical protein